MLCRRGVPSACAALIPSRRCWCGRREACRRTCRRSFPALVVGLADETPRVTIRHRLWEGGTAPGRLLPPSGSVEFTARGDICYEGLSSRRHSPRGSKSFPAAAVFHIWGSSSPSSFPAVVTCVADETSCPCSFPAVVTCVAARVRFEHGSPGSVAEVTRGTPSCTDSQTPLLTRQLRPHECRTQRRLGFPTFSAVL